MARPNTPEPRSAGFLIAVLALIGVIVGVKLGQATLGLLGGLALGAAIAIIFWLVDRQRR